MAETLVYYKNVKIEIKKNLILHNVNFEQKNGEFVYIIGETGSGKSSFLRTLYCDLPINNGEACICNYNLIKIKKKQIPMLRRKIGILSQDLKLLVDRSVNDNLKFILKSLGWRSIDVINDHILEVLDQVEIANKGCKMPNELSIGEQQQVAIARALLNSPEIILVDEPTGNLDEKAGEKIVRLLHNVKNKGDSSCNGYS